MIGQTISHYKILEKLGEGGMGIVYKAHDTKLERIVALKFLPNYLTSDVAEKERFYHEARAAASLTHQNVAVIYEIGEHEGQLFLAMEYVEGKTLKKLVELDGETLSIKKVLDIAIQACEGLAAAHEKGIVHRDIKSDNIMMTAKGQVKIMDFGLAKVKGATKLTKAGSTLGTAAYMSPEQAQGEEVDHRSDIFSFGVVLYELLTTKLPFRGEHQAALMYSLINEDPQPIARFNDKVSPELERTVYKALAKDRDERYQHIDDMLADLRRERKGIEYAKAGYARTTVSMPAMQPVTKKKSYAKYAIAAAVVVAVVIGVVIFNPFNFQISTQKSNAASEKSTLAVMYFESIPDPEDKDHTGEMLTNLLTTSLFQTKDIEVISRERLYDIQKELGQGDAKVISASVATNIAKRAGVSMMLIGSILQKQPSLAITYRLVEVGSGKIVSTQRLSGFSPDQIFSLVDTLALLVKNDLHVTSSSSEAKSVASATTSSPEAYRSYLEGVELNNRFYAAEAMAAFRRAIELDSNFAMAYYRLANVNLNTLEPDQITAALKKAYALSGTIMERERLLIQSTYATEIERDNSKAISILENLLQKYPLEESAYGALANLYARNAQFEKMLALFLKQAQVDSLNKTVWNQLAYMHTEMNQKQEAFNAVNRYLQLAPAEANPYDSKGDIYAMFDERDSAVIWWQKAIAFRADFPSGEKIFMSALTRQDYTTAEKYFHQFAASKRDEEKLYNELFPVILLISHGQLEKGRAEYQKIFESHKAKKLSGWIIGDLGILFTLDYELRDYPSMLKHAQEYSNELRKDTVTNPNYGRMIVALAQFKNGNREAALRILESVHGVADKNFAARSRYEFGSGIISFEDGKYDAALRQFASALKSEAPHHAPLYFHALCKLKAGHTQDAILELQRLTRWSAISYVPFDLEGFPMGEYGVLAAIKAHYWLGIAYEQQGQKDQAIKSYEKFLEIWKEADFNSGELKDAKIRLSKLKGIAAK
jgi:serine/threonine protein kinase